jgi:hypothetical protein
VRQVSSTSVECVLLRLSFVAALHSDLRFLWQREIRPHQQLQTILISLSTLTVEWMRAVDSSRVLSCRLNRLAAAEDSDPAAIPADFIVH